MNTVAELVAALLKLPQDLAPYVTNGDLDPVPVASVLVVAADFGQMVLVSRLLPDDDDDYGDD
jgi:hypothetical protein